MARIQTPIAGITTTSAHEDGDTASLVNLRPKNGALIPVTPRKVEQSLSQEYDIVFIHRSDEYENWIGIRQTDTAYYIYWDIKNDPKLVRVGTGKINSVQQIGNTVSLITDDTIYYILFRNGDYKYLGELPYLPAISFGTSDPMYEASRNIPQNYTVDDVKAAVNNARKEITDLRETVLFDACFVRYAFRFYDGSLTKHSPPILVMPTRKIVGGSGQRGASVLTLTTAIPLTETPPKITAYGYALYAEYDFTLNGNYAQWADLIESVDIFMSAPLGISNINTIESVPTSGIPGDVLDVITRLSPDAMKSVTSTSNFYLIDSIPLGGTGTEIIPSSQATVSNMENLIYQEVMTDDPFSQHIIGAKNGYVYNGRLLLSGVKTTFYHGFHVGYFQWYDMYNGIDFPDDKNGKYITEVELEISGTLKSVYSYIVDTFSLFTSAFLSYPDPRAKRMSIYWVDPNDASGTWQRVFTANLIPHDFLNLSYYLNDGLNPIVEKALGSYAPRDTDVPVTTFEANKVKASELNNPLLFPVANTYEVGAGNILTMATNAMNVSDRNFGQWPLYVFTDNGIWAMSVGDGEVAFSSAMPTSSVLPTSGIVCESPYGVFFTARRGLMLINDRNVEFISPQIEQLPPEMNIETNEYCDGVVLPVGDKFPDVLKNVSAIVYNHYENEVIVNAGGDLNYVYHIDSKSFYLSAEKIGVVVQNSFPDVYVTSGADLKNYGESGDTMARVQIVTRPIRYKTTDIKRFGRLILRALLYGVVDPLLSKFSLSMVQYSNDEINFIAAKGLPIKEGNHKDIDMGMFSRTKAKYLSFIFAGAIDEKSRIYYLDSDVDAEYNNTKLR